MHWPVWNDVGQRPSLTRRLGSTNESYVHRWGDHESRGNLQTHWPVPYAVWTRPTPTWRQLTTKGMQDRERIKLQLAYDMKKV